MTKRKPSKIPSTLTWKPYLKSFLLPAATIAFVFVATGSVVTVATSATSPAAALRGSATADRHLQLLCSQYWGAMSADGKLCEFKQVFHVNMAHAGHEVLPTGISVVPGDTVILSAQNAAQAVVGEVDYGFESARFTAKSAGYLSFHAPKHAPIFSVQQVQVERCYGAIEGQVKAVPCPGSV